MSAANVPLIIDQGEDWTVQLVWTDSFDEPVYVIHPCRLEIKTKQGQTVVQLETDPEIPDGSIPGINVSSDIGLIQLHVPKEQTVALLPGVYHYDLFATMDDDNEYTGTQVTRLLYGDVTVNKRITRL